MSGSIIQSGITRRQSIAVQSALKTRALAGGGQVLRRIQAEPNLQVDTFQSQEILASQQVRDYRNGVERGIISYASQLAPGAQIDFFQGMLRRNYATVTAYTAATIAAVAGPPGTFTRSVGSWITDGFRIGMVVRQTGWTTTAVANNNRNYRIIGLTATVMTVSGIGDEAVVAKAAGDSVTVTVVGKVTFIPATNQLRLYYTFEDWLPDMTVPKADIYEDCRIQTIGINVPATGMATISAQLLARNVVTLGAAHFTAPAAANTTQSVTGISGMLRIAGVDVAIITSLSLQIAAQVGAEPNIGARQVFDIVLGPLAINGNGSAMLTDYTFIDLMRNETEAELILLMESDSTINAPFICVTLPRIRIQNPTKSDGQMGLMQRFSFVGLENTSSTAYEATSFMIQDSAA